MKLKQSPSSDDAERGFLKYAKPFIAKASQKGYHYVGLTSSLIYEDNEEEPQAGLMVLYFYRAVPRKDKLEMELLQEYAENTFMDEATTLLSITNVSPRYLSLTLIYST